MDQCNNAISVSVPEDPIAIAIPCTLEPHGDETHIASFDEFNLFVSWISDHPDARIYIT